jgi:hypothetical protein
MSRAEEGAGMHAGGSEATAALRNEQGYGPMIFGLLPADGGAAGEILPARHTVLLQ